MLDFFMSSKTKVIALEERIQSLEAAVFPDGKGDGIWSLKEHILNKCGDDLWAPGRGLWRRLDALEDFVYGQNGEHKPERARVCDSLDSVWKNISNLWRNKADNEPIWNELRREKENTERELNRLREKNAALERKLQGLEDLMHKTINACLGKIQ